MFAEAVPTDAAGRLRAAAAGDVDLGLVPAALVLKAPAPGAGSDQGTAGALGRGPPRVAQGVERAHGVTQVAHGGQRAHARPADDARGIGDEGRAYRGPARAQ